uniref:Uncharacterized protein n=1 Tax=Anguilla anguilla TaxID=7936 RepID=A0A0E9T9Q3_ANGAN
MLVQYLFKHSRKLRRFYCAQLQE